MKNIFYTSLLLLFTASCSTSNVSFDYDRDTNFNSITTYNYYTDNTIQLNKFDSLIFINALETSLHSKGLKKSDNPDIMVAVKVYSRAEDHVNTVNLGIGGGSRWLGIGTDIGIPVKKKIINYSFQIDMDNAQTKNLIWTGEALGSTSYGASSDSKSALYKSKIQALLKQYPPNVKKTKKTNYYN